MEIESVPDQYGRTRNDVLADAAKRIKRMSRIVVSWRSSGNPFTWHAATVNDEAMAQEFYRSLARDVTVAQNTIKATRMHARCVTRKAVSA